MEANIRERRMEYTENKLTAHFQNNENFTMDFFIMESFYRNKFNDIVDSEHDEFNRQFSSGVRSQYFNGYYMIRELLDHEDTNIPDEALTEPEGFITDEMPELLRAATAESFEEAIFSDEMRELTVWSIKRYENIRPTLRQMAFDICCLGAKQAMLDERDQRGLKRAVPPEQRLLGDVFDNNFINPQIYLANPNIGTEFEMWPIIWSSSVAPGEQAGEVFVNVLNLSDKTHYQINIYLTNKIPEQERITISENILERVMYSGIDRNNITASLAVVEDFLMFVQE